MRKALENNDPIVGQFFAFSAEQLDAISTRMKIARKERVNPGEALIIQAAPGLWFYDDPKVSRGDLERSVRVIRTRKSAQLPGPRVLELPASTGIERSETS